MSWCQQVIVSLTLRPPSSHCPPPPPPGHLMFAQPWFVYLAAVQFTCCCCFNPAEMTSLSLVGAAAMLICSAQSHVSLNKKRKKRNN